MYRGKAQLYFKNVPSRRVVLQLKSYIYSPAADQAFPPQTSNIKKLLTPFNPRRFYIVKLYTSPPTTRGLCQLNMNICHLFSRTLSY